MSGTSSDMSTKSRSRIFLVNLGGRVAATPALRGSMPGEIEEQVRASGLTTGGADDVATVLEVGNVEGRREVTEKGGFEVGAVVASVKTGIWAKVEVGIPIDRPGR